MGKLLLQSGMVTCSKGKTIQQKQDNMQRGGEEQDCTRLAVLIQCHDSTGFDEMGDYFAIEADTMIDIVRVT